MGIYIFLITTYMRYLLKWKSRMDGTFLLKLMHYVEKYSHADVKWITAADFRAASSWKELYSPLFEFEVSPLGDHNTARQPVIPLHHTVSGDIQGTARRILGKGKTVGTIHKAPWGTHRQRCSPTTTRMDRDHCFSHDTLLLYLGFSCAAPFWLSQGRSHVKALHSKLYIKTEPVWVVSNIVFELFTYF